MNRNNNPLNVKNDLRDPWKGSVRTDERGHAVFASADWGVRAALHTLRTKWRHGKQTITQIIQGTAANDFEDGWAPASDTIGSIAGAPPNSPEEYIRFIEQHAGIGALEELPDPAQEPLLWLRLAQVMSRYEMGEACPWSDLLRGGAIWSEELVEA